MIKNWKLWKTFEHNSLHKHKGENCIIENFIILYDRRILKAESYKEKRDRQKMYNVF
jgi:hypothetical protein